MNENKTFSINIIEPIGFCNGVKNAISKVYEIKKQYADKKILILGQLVHNDLVINQLEKNNIKILDIKPSEFENALNNIDSNTILIFSAHGHDEKLNKICEDKKITFFDTTCPIVNSIENKAKEILKNENNIIIYIGKKDHPETESMLKLSNKVVFYDNFSRNLVDFYNKNIYVMNQSTICGRKLDVFYYAIKSKINNPIFIKTSCIWVEKRLKISSIINNSQTTLNLVLGSNKSSNTMELYNNIKDLGFNVLLIDSIKKLNDVELNNYKDINIMSGTSTSIEFINDVINYLKFQQKNFSRDK